MYNNKSERVTIVIDIMKKLKNFKGKNGEIINLYENGICSFINEFKDICNIYINMDDMTGKAAIDMKGKLYFEEIDRNVEYLLPAKKYKTPLFVIRGYNK